MALEVRFDDSEHVEEQNLRRQAQSQTPDEFPTDACGGCYVAAEFSTSLRPFPSRFTFSPGFTNIAPTATADIIFEEYTLVNSQIFDDLCTTVATSVGLPVAITIPVPGDTPIREYLATAQAVFVDSLGITCVDGSAVSSVVQSIIQIATETDVIATNSDLSSTTSQTTIIAGNSTSLSFSPTPTRGAAPEGPASPGNWSIGRRAGLGVGLSLAVLLILGLIYFLIRMRRSKQKKAELARSEKLQELGENRVHEVEAGQRLEADNNEIHELRSNQEAMELGARISTGGKSPVVGRPRSV